MIKINEQELKSIIGESVKKIISESGIDFSSPTWSKDFFNSLTDVNSYEKEPLHWYDETENVYTISAMIKSDMNPISKKFKATNINDAIEQALDYFVKFTSNGEKDVDIFYVKHDGYDGI